MVPAAFVTLDALPLTPVGKVDRRALPAPDQARPDLESAYVAPRNDTEKILADIWTRILGVERVGIHDNFFELGGDSILGIQVIARANQAGLRLTPRHIFEAPTVARLAMLAGSGPAVQAEQGIVQGPVPLTPIQRWFFEQELVAPHHWNQAVILEVEQTLTPDLLRATVAHLLEHHDALRLRFKRVDESASQRTPPSAWQQVNAGLNQEPPVEWVDLSDLAKARQRSTVEARASALQASLDLTDGPLMRVAYFDLGPEQPDRMLIVVHHLAFDGMSWRILLEDFQAAYEQVQRAEAVRLPPKTTSFQRWAQRLEEYAQSEAVQEELDYWLTAAEDGTPRLPVDFPGGSNIEASAQSVTVALDREETQALLKEVPAAYRVEINDTLLTALVQAVNRWTGSEQTLLEMEGHGREDLWDDVDLSRTVGWFTMTYPVALRLKRGNSPGDALMAIKEQLRQVPHGGLGYGLLRYLSTDREIIRCLRDLPQPEIGFNYLGQFDQAIAGSYDLGLAQESVGPDRDPAEYRTHLLDINGGIVDGRLRLEWTYSENVHRRATIERVGEDFVQALRTLIAHCGSSDAGGVTPSDFKLASLSQRDLDKVLAKLNRG
jgi:non-ribosomal peptide synthase protein (TIGR01720 family)